MFCVGNGRNELSARKVEAGAFLTISASFLLFVRLSASPSPKLSAWLPVRLFLSTPPTSRTLPLSLRAGRVATEVVKERLVVVQEQLDLLLAVRLERQPVGAKARPAHVLEDAASLEHRVGEDRVEALVHVLDDAACDVGLFVAGRSFVATPDATRALTLYD